MINKFLKLVGLESGWPQKQDLERDLARERERANKKNIGPRSERTSEPESPEPVPNSEIEVDITQDLEASEADSEEGGQ